MVVAALLAALACGTVTLAAVSTEIMRNFLSERMESLTEATKNGLTPKQRGNEKKTTEKKRKRDERLQSSF